MRRLHFAATSFAWMIVPQLVALAQPMEPTSPAWVAAKTVELARTRVTLSQPVLVGRSTERLWFPTLAKLGDGRLLAIMSVDYDSARRHPQAQFRFSADGGWSWEALPRQGGQSDASLILPNGDCLLLPVYLWSHPQGLAGFSQTVPRGGRRLQASTNQDLVVSGLPRRPITIDLGEGHHCFGFNGQTLKLQDGRYLATIYGRYVGDEYYHLIAVTSTDGRTWKHHSTIATPAIIPRGTGGEGPCEAALGRLQDGRLMCIFRIGSHLTYGQAWSTDEGATWTKPTTVWPGDPSLTMSNTSIRSVQPSLAVLKNGIVTLAGGRPGVSVWINERGDGQDWARIDLSAHHNALHPDEPHAVAERDATKHSTSGYTEIVALDDQQLLVIYDRLRAGWDNLAPPSQSNSVWVVRLTVEPKR